MLEFDYLKQIEATQLDYKISVETERPKSWLKTVSAFANTSGGHILFGFGNDTHLPVGLADAQKSASCIAEYLASRIEPRVRYDIKEIFDTDTGKRCIDLEIVSGPNFLYYYVHEQTKVAFIRHGDRSEPCTAVELNNLILKGQNKTFDELPSEYNFSDVSFTLLAATYKREKGEVFSYDKDLVSMGLMDDSGVVTNAGALLSDQGLLKQSKIVCTRWKGLEKGSIDGDALDDREFCNASLIMLLENAEAFIKTNSKNPWTVNGMRREEHSDYSLPCVREVLVNAVIHRDYQLVGSEIHIDIFDDRMEIMSPGGMMNGSRIQDWDLRKVPSMRRNEIISDIFGRLNFMDRRGSGISRILKGYTGRSKQPRFFSNEYYFLVVLPNRSIEGSTIFVEKNQLSTGENTIFAEKNQLSAGESTIFSSADHFRDKAAGVFSKKKLDLLVKMFEKYGYNYSFCRRNIESTFSVKANMASVILKKCVDNGIVQRKKRNEYYFIQE